MKIRVAVAVVSVWMMGMGSAGAADSFKVIVSAGMAGSVIARQTVAQVFLGPADRWGDGRPVAPVDLSATSPTRAAFSEAVLDMSVLGVRQYWTRNISSGRFPPPVRSADEDVIAFVAARPNAIGYVSAEAPLPETVRVLPIR